jgi:predicted dehydrogenase
MQPPAKTTNPGKAVRYAVVGLGHIAQAAVLPGFSHARHNSQLAALVSDDPVKLKELGDRYHVDQLLSYDDYDGCLQSGLIDAVFIAIPNDMHCEYAVRAAEAGVHVLCEKPMAVTEIECDKMIAAAESSQVRLMIAYRLHFDRANLRAIELIRSGPIGEPRLFTSLFTNDVREGDIRLQGARGGGTLYDIGIYCINAVRYLWRDEPTEVFACTASGADPRFHEVDETASAVLRFSNDRLASFTTSFGGGDASMYRVVGSKGELHMEPAYEYAAELGLQLTVGQDTRRETFPKRDQFGAEIAYFSDCIQNNKEPEPSGHEGLADVRIIEALYRSAAERRPVAVEPVDKRQRPSMEQRIEQPPVEKVPLVHTESPSR